MTTCAVEQVKFLSSKRGKPWNFPKETKEQKTTRKDNCQEERTDKENECAWSELQLSEAEWGYRKPVCGTALAEVMKGWQVMPGKKGIATMG